jgi:XTP/dITP diphosphohydrolase
MLTILLTSARVAPGLLSWQAWEALRGASRVLVGSGHPQLVALAEAGVVPEIVAVDDSDVAAMAQVLVGAATSKGTGSVAWLAPAGAVDAELLAALSEARVPGGLRLLRGSHDLPGAHLIDLVATMDTLRVNCPWDRQQTHSSLAPHLLEEPYEALEALENGDHQALREELGDVLLQVAFHARIAAERAPEDDGYTIDDVADTIVAKLIRRHPHVFANVSVASTDDVSRNWDEIKKAERAARRAARTASEGSEAPEASGADGGGTADGPPSVLDGVVFGQPALSLAAQVLRRAARAGAPAGLLGDLPGLGDELLRLVSRARAAGIDPELELRAAVRQLATRVRDWELKHS